MDSYDIKKLENIAYINSQIACAQATIAGMQATNTERLANGYTVAYGEEEFENVINRFGLHHNSVLTTFNNGL